MLPMAHGATMNNNALASGKNWNTQSLGHTMTNAQMNNKNKDRYLALQQSREQTMKQQYMIGTQNINSSAMSTQGAPMTSVDMMQNHLSIIHQSPTLSPSSQ
jgi:hypothetical protein